MTVRSTIGKHLKFVFKMEIQIITLKHYDLKILS